MALHFNCSPLDLDKEQILDYLEHLKTKSKTPSSSYFKHTVYGLSFACRVTGKDASEISLPALKNPQKLPVILSQQEIKRLIKAPELLKHRILLATLYGCGLRRFELLNIKLPDVDLDRKMLHISILHFSYFATQLCDASAGDGNGYHDIEGYVRAYRYQNNTGVSACGTTRTGKGI